jgi:hypothetical protein
MAALGIGRVAYSQDIVVDTACHTASLNCRHVRQSNSATKNALVRFRIITIPTTKHRPRPPSCKVVVPARGLFFGFCVEEESNPKSV